MNTVIHFIFLLQLNVLRIYCPNSSTHCSTQHDFLYSRQDVEEAVKNWLQFDPEHYRTQEDGHRCVQAGLVL